MYIRIENCACMRGVHQIDMAIVSSWVRLRTWYTSLVPDYLSALP